MSHRSTGRQEGARSMKERESTASIAPHKLLRVEKRVRCNILNM